jgi:hypothetical protein
MHPESVQSVSGQCTTQRAPTPHVTLHAMASSQLTSQVDIVSQATSTVPSAGPPTEQTSRVPHTTTHGLDVHETAQQLVEHSQSPSHATVSSQRSPASPPSTAPESRTSS